MADQKINALPTKTSPSTGDKMLMIGTAEEYQIDYDQLATAILNKLSTQSFSSLGTTAKTVLGGINELNSKSYLLQGGMQILNNADMNDYVTPGNYFCVSNAVAGTLSNCPFTHAFNLKVEFSNGAGLPCQIYREYDTGRIAYRVQPSSNSSSWSQYVYFSDDATIFAGTAIRPGDDLNDYTTPGIYYSASQSVSSTLANTPETIRSGFAMFVFPMSANISQVIFLGDAGGVMYTRSTITSGFQKWYKFDGTLISS